MNEDFQKLNKAIVEMVATNNSLIKLLGNVLDKVTEQKETFNKIDCYSDNIESKIKDIKKYEEQ